MQMWEIMKYEQKNEHFFNNNEKIESICPNKIYVYNKIEFAYLHTNKNK